MSADNSHRLFSTFERFKFLDQHRNTNFKESFPEMYKLVDGDLYNIK